MRSRPEAARRSAPKARRSLQRRRLEAPSAEARCLPRWATMGWRRGARASTCSCTSTGATPRCTRRRRTSPGCSATISSGGYRSSCRRILRPSRRMPHRPRTLDWQTGSQAGLVLLLTRPSLALDRCRELGGRLALLAAAGVAFPLSSGVYTLMAARHLFASITHFTNHNYLFVLLSLLTCCSGAGRTLSFDAMLGPLTGGWRRALYHGAPCSGPPYRGATWVVLLLRLQLAVVYLFAFNPTPNLTLTLAITLTLGLPLRLQPSGLTSSGRASSGLTTDYIHQVYLSASNSLTSVAC